MGIQINTNVMALNAQHRLAETGMKYSKALERLSSGLRINRAADDAAGLAISEKLRAQVKGLTQASRNAQDGISMIQTGEGSLNESHSILQRMRELVVQAGTATVSSGDKSQIQSEVGQLQSELDRIAQTTQFNGVSLLTGGLGSKVTATTAGLADGLSQATSNGAKAGTYTFTAVAGTTSGTKLTLDDGAGHIQTVDNVALPTGLNTASVNFGQLGLSINVNSNLTATSLNGKTITTTGGQGQFLVGANASAAEFIGVTVSAMDSSGLSVTATAVDVTSNTLTTQGMLASIDTAIGSVSTARSTLGAVQNRLEHTINSLAASTENLSASESRIRDTDVSQETTNMVTAQILSQAGTSVLAQANQAPQGALALLRGG